jgi:multidrug resistance efflux pump
VQAEDVLVELDTEAERCRLEEEHASLAAISAQLDVLRQALRCVLDRAPTLLVIAHP